MVCLPFIVMYNFGELIRLSVVSRRMNQLELFYNNSRMHEKIFPRVLVILKYVSAHEDRKNFLDA